MNHRLEDLADETAVEFCYMLLLGREPENPTVIADTLHRSRSIQQLRSDVIASPEYQLALMEHVRGTMLDQYISCKAENIDPRVYLNTEDISSVTVLQTADPVRYKEMIEVSSRYNGMYAKKHGLGFVRYVGIKRGSYPHHAAFNRVHLLSEMIDQGCTDWVLYIDADAIVIDPTFDIVSHLSAVRAAGKCMVLHSVFPDGDLRYRWWDVNTGCFAIDLSSGRARSVVKAWAGIYNDLYSMADYHRATMWHGWIIDDQNTFWPILRHFDMESHVSLESIQGEQGFVHQFLRHRADDVSSEEELRTRVQDIETLGSKIYGVKLSNTSPLS